MKKFYIPYIVVLTIIAVIYSVTTFTNNKSREIQSSENIPEKKSEIISKTPNNVNDDYKEIEQAKEYYTIKSENKSILVYNSENEVVKKLEIDYNSLRDYDKKQFDEGITVDTLEDVYHIAEDFSG